MAKTADNQLNLLRKISDACLSPAECAFIASLIDLCAEGKIAFTFSPIIANGNNYSQIIVNSPYASQNQNFNRGAEKWQR